MRRHARVYRRLTFLYPRSFRHEYGPDLTQAFDDVVRHRGAAAAWSRACVDLAVTVPRYNLEALMQRNAPSSALIAVVLAVAAGVFGALTLGMIGAAPLIVLGAVIVVTERSALARSLAKPRPPGRGHSRAALALGLVAVASIVSWVYHVTRYDELAGTTLFLHNAIGLPSVLGALGFGLAALVRRSRPSTV